MDSLATKGAGRLNCESQMQKIEQLNKIFDQELGPYLGQLMRLAGPTSGSPAVAKNQLIQATSSGNSKVKLICIHREKIRKTESVVGQK
jgi:hypothetical protein